MTTKLVVLKTGEQFNIPVEAFPIEIDDCGCCGEFHIKPLLPGFSANYQNDCRFNDNRYTSEELNEIFGEEGEGWVPSYSDEDKDDEDEDVS